MKLRLATQTISDRLKSKPSNILNGSFVGGVNIKLGLTISLTCFSASIDESILRSEQLTECDDCELHCANLNLEQYAIYQLKHCSHSCVWIIQHSGGVSR